MNEKEDFRGCSFWNILSEIPVEKEEIHSILRYHKNKLRIFFNDEIKDEAVAAHIYLLLKALYLPANSIGQMNSFKHPKLLLKIYFIPHTLPANKSYIQGG
jgi:hypothetical protein